MKHDLPDHHTWALLAQYSNPCFLMFTSRYQTESSVSAFFTWSWASQLYLLSPTLEHCHELGASFQLLLRNGLHHENGNFRPNPRNISLLLFKARIRKPFEVYAVITYQNTHTIMILWTPLVSLSRLYSYPLFEMVIPQSKGLRSLFRIHAHTADRDSVKTCC